MTIVADHVTYLLPRSHSIERLFCLECSTVSVFRPASHSESTDHPRGRREGGRREGGREGGKREEGGWEGGRREEGGRGGRVREEGGGKEGGREEYLYTFVYTSEQCKIHTVHKHAMFSSSYCDSIIRMLYTNCTGNTQVVM